ncbi:hypothetical protein HMN09_01382900 [Mycena chlorophos]|uniref:ABM domain-containing protein n=1 Tax=Mycena chlorophos TaxID=658473 RepID=A0A8H6VP62_MYCCL|nr:hypothetical protein HMN09_01382900 [Mycena chlorophos]
MPTIQVAQFPVSSDFQAAPQKFASSLDIIKTADGHIRFAPLSYYGVQVEDEKNAYFISGDNCRCTVWESYEHHAKLIAEPSYKTLIESLRPATADSTKFSRHHIDISTDALTALSSPATEIVVFTLKNGAGDADAMAPLMEELKAGLDAAVGAHPPCFFGQGREEKNKFVLVVGWDTVAAHWEAVKEGTSLHATVQKIAAIADIGIGHSLLKAS